MGDLRNILFAVGIAAVVVSLSGCAPEAKEEPEALKPAVVRPKEELISVLRARVAEAGPMRGTGQCKLEYSVEGKKKKENIPVKWWLNPPSEIYMQGDVAFDPRGIVLGANAEDFWLSLRPKEISSYWWGRWSDKDDPEMLLISPRVMLEALGLVTVKDASKWTLGWQGPYEVLTKRGEQGLAVKKVSVQGPEALVRKIEYFDVWGAPTVTAELNDYEEAVNGFFLPMNIRIVKHGSEGKDSSADIEIRSVKETQYSQKQRDYLFKAPEPEGFEHVYISVNGRWVEQ